MKFLHSILFVIFFMAFITISLFAQDKYVDKDGMPILGKPFYKSASDSQWDYVNYSSNENYKTVKPEKQKVTSVNKSIHNGKTVTENNISSQNKEITQESILFADDNFTDNYGMPIFGKPFYRNSSDNQWDYVNCSVNEHYKTAKSKNEDVGVVDKNILNNKRISENDFK
jgi:hypothetical protein